MVYCTLFDSNYLDKGIAMINSLIRVDLDAKIYVLCMDGKCKEVLDDYLGKSIISVSMNDFIDENLSSLLKERTRAEFCWTCTGKLIKYVLIEKKEAICTYIDSDLYFYSNPSVLLDEMISLNCSVQAIAHNFPHDYRLKKRIETIGKLCVEFNTFSRSSNSLFLLDQWIKQCEENCSIELGGDQKYTDNWDQYDFVNVSRNLGAGVAPWNIERFKQKNKKLHDKETNEEYQLIFYHYQNVINKERYSVSIEPFYHCLRIDRQLVLDLYLPYIKELELIKRDLEKKYGITPLVKKYTSIHENKKRTIWNKTKLFISMSLTEKIAIIKNLYLKIMRKRLAEVDTSKY